MQIGLSKIRLLNLTGLCDVYFFVVGVDGHLHRRLVCVLEFEHSSHLALGQSNALLILAHDLIFSCSLLLNKFLQTYRHSFHGMVADRTGVEIPLKSTRPAQGCPVRSTIASIVDQTFLTKKAAYERIFSALLNK
ncbi:hypothetical protein CAP51_03515 [Acinetobacter populi]|uniref:Uncharacterized protein n=1 Tax=Acinetobacter populi TaxID=1582270 RepID=A0A1Z9Z2I8_9GAMM|nr:hypothetical protein CAP51_03515 [Acinetobacter populi]